MCELTRVNATEKLNALARSLPYDDPSLPVPPVSQKRNELPQPKGTARRQY